MKRSLFTLAIIGLLFSCQPQQEASSEAPQAPEESATPSIVGAWEITSSTNANGEDNTPYRSIIIYTDSFYSVEIANESRPSWPQIEDGEETPEENIRNAYEGLISNSGRYAIEGDSIIHDVIVAKWPNFMNDFPRATAAFTLEGDKLVTTGNRGSTTYKRIR
jgi:hypothetical protein